MDVREALNAYCTFCCQEEETINHQLVGCSYARVVWFKVLKSCGWQGLMPGYGDSYNINAQIK
jgi:hypothetical protein